MFVCPLPREVLTELHAQQSYCSAIGRRHAWFALQMAMKAVSGRQASAWKRPNPRSYGCFPLVLAEFVRAERQLRLPEAIRKMKSFPAQRIGLPDRGVLRDGFKADLVVFDKHTVKTRATRANPKVFPEGIPYVVVNGKVVID
jgi:N-acyl-D-aspartate/D-glutamate deacylase